MRVITLASLAFALAASAIPLAIRADHDVSSQEYASFRDLDAEGITRGRRLGADSAGGPGSIPAEPLSARGVQDSAATRVDTSREPTAENYSLSSSTAGGAPQSAEKTKSAADSVHGADSAEHSASPPSYKVDGGASDTRGFLAEAAGAPSPGVGKVARAATIISDKAVTSESEEGVAGDASNAVTPADIPGI